MKLNGHSGCSILLYDNIVRKTSPTFEYNKRLKDQMLKQSNFKHTILKSPAIYEYGYDEFGKFYFDMEYIHGINFSMYFQKETLYNCMEMIDLITSFQTKTKKIDIKNEVINKIQNIELDSNTKEILTLNNWLVDIGYGHGDLTFENIIIGKNDIYLIDFLDSFIDGPLVDESKILQDAFCYWSFKDKDSAPRRKLLSVCERFNSKQHYYMLLLHLVRILPYINVYRKQEILCMIENTKTKINQF